MSYSKTIKGSHRPILDFVNEIGSYCIKAGILESNNPVGANGIPVAEYGLANEYGTDRIPARPFIGSTVDEQQGLWLDTVAKKAPDICTWKVSINTVVDTLGKKIKVAIKDQIKFISIPKNAPETVEKKGFDDPLIDTGLMLNTIDYEVDSQ